MKFKLLLFLLLAVVTQSNAQMCFGTRTSYPVGINPSSLCRADFNNDGKTDLAVANREGTVSLLLGLGNGVFVPDSEFEVGFLAADICTADFNNDTRTDLATANQGPWDITMLLADSLGSFETGSVIQATNPNGIVSADYNMDGNADLAIATASRILVSFGDGLGGFGPTASYAIGIVHNSVVSADFNGDNFPDIATAGGLNSVWLIFNNGNGVFGATTGLPVGDNPESLITDDFNGDGNADIATANRLSDDVSVSIGNGAGAFSNTNFPAGSTPLSLASGDFDNDSIIDLAVVNAASINVSLLKGNSAGAFASPVNFAVDSFPNSIVADDFNGDGKIDLAIVTVVTNNDLGKVDVLLNCNTIGIDKLSAYENQIFIYPNPNNGVFRIDVSSVGSSVLSVEVDNILGETLYSLTGLSDNTSNLIDLSNYHAGVYFAKIHIDKNTIVKKFVVQ